MGSNIGLSSQVKEEVVCRTCLSKENVFYSVFDVSLGTETLASVITTITGIRFGDGDGLPTTVCQDCKEKATVAYEYKCRSLEADQALRVPVVVKSEQAAPEEPVLAQIVAVKTEVEIPADVAEPDDGIDVDMNLPSTSGGVPMVDASDGSSTYCPVCGISFDDAAGLTNHMWQSHPDIMGPKGRGRPRQLETEEIVRTLSERGVQPTSRIYTCFVCEVEIFSKEDLALHLLEHRDEKLLSCSICRKTFLKMTDFDQHQCEIVSDLVQAQAQEAAQSSQGAQPAAPVLSEGELHNSATEMLLGNFLNATNSEEFDGILHMCSVCRSVYLSKPEMIDHRDKDHPEQSLRCGHCNKSFASLRTAARHRGTCARVERPFTCATCGAKFQYEITLNKHILRYHAGRPVSIRFDEPMPETSSGIRVRPQCRVCKKTFITNEQLQIHLEVYRNSEQIFECDICMKRFHRRNNLKSHMLTHQTRRAARASSCLCLYCGRAFSNSSNLIVHMRRHTGEKPYQCDFCGKGFPRSSDLQCHRRSHTGERPCVCNICGKAFSRSNKLSRHMRVHTGVKPYKCIYCNKCFSQSNDLTLHIRRHTGDKPFVCELCGDRFIQGTALQNHRRIHASYSPIPPEELEIINAAAAAARAGPSATVTSASQPFSLALAN